MSAKQRAVREPVFLGTVGIILILLFVYGAFVKRVPFVHGYRVQAVFQSANQLKKGSPVRVAGVDVGKVVKIEDGPGTTSKVTLEIKSSGRPVHTDATAKIRPRLFLEGGFMVDVKSGSPSAPELKDGGTIPLSATTVPVQLHQILGAFNRPARDSFARILDQLAIALDKGGAQAAGKISKPLETALRQTAIISEAARGSEVHDVSDIVRGTSKITAALAKHDRDLGELVTNFTVTSGALAAESDALRATVRELDAVLRESPAALTAIDGSLPELNRFVTSLRPSLRAMPPVLDNTSALLTQLRKLVAKDQLPLLVSRLSPTVKGLPGLSQLLGQLFVLVTPVTDCLRDHAVPVLNAKIDDGALSSDRPVWQDLVHGLVGLTGTAQNFDGNGYAVRYLAGGGEQMFSTGSTSFVGPIYGTTSEPIIGSNPLWLGRGNKPPLQPGAACKDQALPNLKARTGLPLAAGRQSRTKGSRPRLTPKQLERILRHPKIGSKAAGGGKG